MRNRFSAWYAADLERYNNGYKVNLLSVHKDMINFQVENWPHLLMIAKSGFERGPCTIGLDYKLFVEIQEIIESADEISFNNYALTFSSGDSSYSINWREGKRLSFAPFKIGILDYAKVNATVEHYCRTLKDIDQDTVSAILLGIPGGADYFRTEVEAYFPVIIKALFKQNEQEFMNACRKLIGLGHGSSPSGDDLICGALLAYHHFIADQLFIENIAIELRAEAGKTSLMGRHMLEIGLSGLTPDVFKVLLISITMGSIKTNLLRRVLKIGSSTGIDLLVALIFFTKSYLDFTQDSNVI